MESTLVPWGGKNRRKKTSLSHWKGRGRKETRGVKGGKKEEKVTLGVLVDLSSFSKKKGGRDR